LNKIFRRDDQDPVRHDDILSRGYEDWDSRVSEAISGQTAWKYTAWVCLALLTGSGTFNVWQAQQTKVQVVHVVHDSIGGVISVSVSSDTPGDPTQAMLKAALEAWIVNVRSVYVDANALRRGILAAYDLVDAQSQAAGALGTFFNTQDPFVRAETETVALENVVAIPPTAATIGPNGQQSWMLQWTEHVTSRDGQNETRQAWAGNITFNVKRPTSVTQAEHNPNGLHIISYSWTGK
jgi:type IV secretory pathway TrbF-like protein